MSHRGATKSRRSHQEPPGAAEATRSHQEPQKPQKPPGEEEKKKTKKKKKNPKLNYPPCETICHATLTQESSHLLRKKRFEGKEIAPASSGMGQIKLHQISMTISGLVAPQVARKNARHPKQISAPPTPPSSTLCQHWPCGASSAQCQLRHGRGQRGVEAERPEQRLPYKLSSKQLKAFSSKHHA